MKFEDKIKLVEEASKVVVFCIIIIMWGGGRGICIFFIRNKFLNEFSPIIMFKLKS